MTSGSTMSAATLVLAAASVVCLPVRSAGQSVLNSKHNLSAQSGNDIRADTEGQVCVFCHTPHSTGSAAQLWNKEETSVSAYTLYDSDYLTSLSYDAPTQLNQRSKLCMSCHDGTIALGSVYNLPGGGGAGTITMSGGISTMPTGAGGYLGTDLSNDHPVGVGYNTAKDPELVVRAWPWNTDVALDPDASNGKVECHSCHDPHSDQYGSFLRMSNANAALCTHCHNKSEYAISIHRQSTASYTPEGGSATTVSEWSCRSCHTAHAGGGVPYLLRAVEQQSCYDGTNTGCHGSSAAASNDVQTDMAKVYAHPTDLYDGRHIRRITNETPAELGSANRHAECQDCHNPHQAQQAVAQSTRGTLRISAALKGTWGVEPTSWPSAPSGMTNNDVTFATPASYTVVPTPTDEYQVCLKCHSGYVSLPVGKRDIAEEINPNYVSYHGIVPGGASNPNVTTTTTNEPWASGKRVWCSDCHGSEDAAAPAGSHGSANVGVGPGTSNSDKMLVATITSSSTGTPLCLVCHKEASYSSGSTGSAFGQHGRGNHKVTAGCFACHMWDYAGTSLATGGNSGKINAHGWNKLYYWRENGSTLTAATRVMADRFNGGYISDMDYAAKRCWTDDLGGCSTHTGGKTY